MCPLAASVVATVVALSPPVEPPTPERIQELVKKLEEPTRRHSDQNPGPPDYPWPTFDFRWHSGEFVGELKRAGDTAVPELLALLEDTSKPGQARAHAAMLLMQRLVGTKVKPNAKIVSALNAALKDKDPSLRYGVLIWFYGYGLAMNCANWEDLKKAAAEERLTGRPPIEYGAIDLLKRWPPPEERSFTPTVMDAFLPQVVALLADEHPEAAVYAANIVGSFGRPKTGVPELIAALKRKEKEVRIAALRALGTVGRDHPDALKAVMEQLDNKGDLEVYNAAIYAVGGFGPKAKAAVPKLIEALKDERGKFKQLTPPGSGAPAFHLSAVVSLGRIGPDAKEAVPLILAHLESPGNGMYARDAIEALERISPEAGKKARAIQKQREDDFRKENARIATPPGLRPPLPEPPAPPPLSPLPPQMP